MNIKLKHIVCCVFMLGVTPLAAQQRLELSLDKCREMALANSEQLIQADNKIRQAELDRKITNTAYLPKIEGSATGAYMFPDFDVMGMELRMRGTYLAGISLMQPVYTGGKINAGKKLARIGEDVASAQQSLTRMDVLTEADNAYWTYIAIWGKERMLKSYRTQMDTLHKQISTALEAGMATDNDLLRVEAKRSEVLYQLQKVQNGLELCRMSLCRITGVDSETEIVALDTLIPVSHPDELTADIDDRPELLLLKKQVEAGRQQLRMAKSEMLPTIGFAAGYTYFGNIKLNTMIDMGGGMMFPYTQEFRDGIGLAVLSVKIPIFHWGESRKKVSKARYELNNAELELQRNTKLMTLETRNAINNVRDGFLLIETAIQGLKQADENLRVTRNRYAESMATLSDLLDAQSQWQQAESNLIEAKTQYKIYETEYLRTTGRL